jgi:hypothetical protein
MQSMNENVLNIMDAILEFLDKLKDIASGSSDGVHSVFLVW